MGNLKTITVCSGIPRSQPEHFLCPTGGPIFQRYKQSHDMGILGIPGNSLEKGMS